MICAISGNDEFRGRKSAAVSGRKICCREKGQMKENDSGVKAAVQKKYGLGERTEG